MLLCGPQAFRTVPRQHAPQTAACRSEKSRLLCTACATCCAWHISLLQGSLLELWQSKLQCQLQLSLVPALMMHRYAGHRCQSEECYDRVYGDDPLEEGELDIYRSRDFRACFRRQLLTLQRERSAFREVCCIVLWRGACSFSRSLAFEVPCDVLFRSD